MTLADLRVEATRRRPTLRKLLEDALAGRRVEVIPRLAVAGEDAAASIGVSRDFFDLYVLPELRVVRRGNKRIVPVCELERWLEENAERVFE